MRVRRLTPADGPDYRNLLLAALAEHPDAFTSSYDERALQPLEHWAARLAPGETAAQRVFGAFDGARLIGVGGWRRGEHAGIAHRAELFGMAVAASAYRRGAGRAIVEAIVADAHSAGALTMRLTVTDGNVPAERLYARCGFVRCGLEPMAVRVGGGFVAKAMMWRALAGAQGQPGMRTGSSV